MNNKLRKEEYSVAAGFLKTSLSNNRADLAVRFPEFTATYETDLEAKINQVVALEQGVILTDEQKTATAGLYMASKELNTELNYLGFYFKKANLDKAMITKLKKELSKNNIEGANQKITGLVQYIIDKQALLTPKGMSASFPAELTQTRDLLKAKNELQNEKMDALKVLHQANKGVYDELYDYISTIAEAGKIKYKGTVIADQFTISKLIARMRTTNSGGDTPPTA